MKKLLILVFVLIGSTLAIAQVDKEKLALDVSKADAANTKQLMTYIWKRYSTATVSGQVKATVVTEFSFNEKGEIQVKQVGGESAEKQKPGLRGKMQENQMEAGAEYIGKALELSLAYTYMTKGQLMDFIDKATVTEKDGVIEATGTDIYVKGDKLTILIDSKTSLFINKKFSSALDKDPVDGEIKYAKFSSGVVYGSETTLNLPAKKAVITATNKDYTQRTN